VEGAYVGFLQGFDDVLFQRLYLPGRACGHDYEVVGEVGYGSKI
ncbi:uncharacterized protein METZ01_LOCUS99111, partial [marine metagenome]